MNRSCHASRLRDRTREAESTCELLCLLSVSESVRSWHMCLGNNCLHNVTLISAPLELVPSQHCRAAAF